MKKKVIKRMVVCFILVMCATAYSYAQSSKIVYSNALTHFYLTCVDNDTLRSYIVSETSVPIKNIWRMSDREESQVLKVFSEKDIKLFLSEVLDFAENANIDDSKELDGIKVSYKKIYGISCIQFTNPRTKVQFNCNKKTIKKAIEALDTYMHVLPK